MVTIIITSHYQQLRTTEQWHTASNVWQLGHLTPSWQGGQLTGQATAVNQQQSSTDPEQVMSGQ